jgi:predicted TIM-barrel fold metal-dependent hydrolase
MADTPSSTCGTLPSKGVPQAAGPPLAGAEPLIDPHAHFHTAASGRADWQAYNASRLRAGVRMGVVAHVASVLGSWGYTSPTYFPSPEDLTPANDWMCRFAAAHPGRVFAYVAINPNHPAHATASIRSGLEHGAVGIKLAASRKADDQLLDDIAIEAARADVPILQHIWQDRRREWPNQDASDGVELGRLAARHPGTRFLLAHLGGGGDWAHTLHAVRDLPNVSADLSGSGIDRGMLDAAVEAFGSHRVLWAADLTLCTGLTKAWALEAMGLSAEERAAIRWRNAVRLFPRARFAGVAAGEDA